MNVPFHGCVFRPPWTHLSSVDPLGEDGRVVVHVRHEDRRRPRPGKAPPISGLHHHEIPVFNLAVQRPQNRVDGSGRRVDGEQVEVDLVADVLDDAVGQHGVLVRLGVVQVRGPHLHHGRVRRRVLGHVAHEAARGVQRGAGEERRVVVDVADLQQDVGEAREAGSALVRGQDQEAPGGALLAVQTALGVDAARPLVDGELAPGALAVEREAQGTLVCLLVRVCGRDLQTGSSKRVHSISMLTAQL